MHFPRGAAGRSALPHQWRSSRALS
jgi:hypothetical protein